VPRGVFALDICLQIERQSLLESLSVCLVPLVFLLAAGASVGAGLSPEVVAADPLGISGISLG
jgi:hypothetical protein